MASGNTKQRIVDVAIELFNDRGTAAVSTNHIAEAAGISPGNLYYHFHNKEEIILAAYEIALAAYDEVWERAGVAPPSPEAVIDLLEETFEAQWRYRFFQRELPSLVQRDEALRTRYREVQTRRLAAYRALIVGWSAAGVTAPLEGQQLDDLVMASWVVGDQWLAYLEANGGGDSEVEVRRGARLIMEVFRPYLAKEIVDRMTGGSAEPETAAPDPAAANWELCHDCGGLCCCLYLANDEDGNYIGGDWLPAYIEKWLAWFVESGALVREGDRYVAGLHGIDPYHDPRISHLPTPGGEAYRATLPDWVDVRKCQFCHPEHGCQLPHEYRAAICSEYTCELWSE